MRRAPFSLDVRSAGVLLHVTSLPGAPHTGDLGRGAHAFADWLAGAGQRWWQMLPVNPVGDGESPYSTISCFAGEPLLIGLEPLVQAGWLKKSELPSAKLGATGPANYKASRKLRLPLLKKAFERAQPKLAKHADFAAFKEKERFWLSDSALFSALADKYETRDWSCWPDELKNRLPAALKAATHQLGDEVLYLEFLQYAFQRQWDALKKHANTQGVGLIGDLPIFVSHRSSDCWANPKQFLLDVHGRPKFVAGCPPDAFNKDGQLWGNALYDWDAVQKDGYKWWLERLGRMLRLFDAVRLDHFIGFHRYWEIDAKAHNARGGRWRPAKGDGLFAAASRKFGSVPLIAEDLGAVSPEVRALRDKYKFPGMKVLQFAFDGSDEAQHHKPHALPNNSVAYTGTHDNNTTRGWIDDLRSRKDKAARREHGDVLAYLGATDKTVAAQLMRAAFASQANVAVLPIQDVLGEGGKARMNIPGVANGNWRYRVESRELTTDVQEQLKHLTKLYDR